MFMFPRLSDACEIYPGTLRREIFPTIHYKSNSAYFREISEEPTKNKQLKGPKIRDWLTLFVVQRVQRPVNSTRYVLSDTHSDRTIRGAAMTEQAEAPMNCSTAKEEAPPPLAPLPPGEGTEKRWPIAHSISLLCFDFSCCDVAYWCPDILLCRQSIADCGRIVRAARRRHVSLLSFCLCFSCFMVLFSD